MTITRVWRALLFAAALAGYPALAAGDEMAGPAIGAELRDVVVLGGKRVPLPAGAWLVAARERIAGFGEAKGAYGAVEQLVLLSLADAGPAGGQRVRAIAEIHVNLMPTADGWGLPAECRRQEIHLVVLKHDTGWDGSCLFVSNAFIDSRENASPALKQVMAFAETRDLVMPLGWIVNGFRAADRQDFIDLRLYVDPRDAGLPAVARWGGEGNVWLEATVVDSPRRQNYLAGLSDWAIASSDMVERGLRNAPNTEALSWPGNAPASDMAKQRVLDELRALREAGLIETDAYAAQVAQVEAQPAPGSQSSGWVSHSMKKNISFRVFGSSVDWILAYGVTLNSPLSTWITATIVSIHSIIFVANDNYWNEYWKERGRRQGAPQLDFVHVAKTL